MSNLYSAIKSVIKHAFVARETELSQMGSNTKN